MPHNPPTSLLCPVRASLRHLISLQKAQWFAIIPANQDTGLPIFEMPQEVRLSMCCSNLEGRVTNSRMGNSWQLVGGPWEGIISQHHLVAYSPLSKVVIFSKGVNPHSLKISCTSGRSLGPAWKLAPHWKVLCCPIPFQELTRKSPLSAFCWHF